jgi:putative transposase
MKRGYKYRIYPTEEQKKYFDVCFAACRWYWNYALNKINEQYAKDKTHLTSYDISRDLPQLKKKEETKWLSTVDSYSLTYTGMCLDKAFNKFFKKNGGFPKHSQFRYDGSYTIQVKRH